MFTAVSDGSQVAEARRRVGELAVRVGLPQARIDKVAIVVTELATNLLKHGGGGPHPRQPMR
jgi:anti-sigma regulatory factor (Ser/Thr protein kinase)